LRKTTWINTGIL